MRYLYNIVKIFSYDHNGWAVDLRLQFDLRDLWIGVFWVKKTARGIYGTYYHVYICLIPALPLHITVLRPKKRDPRCMCKLPGYREYHQIFCPLYVGK